MQHAQQSAVRPKRSLVTTFFVATLGLFCVVTGAALLSSTSGRKSGRFTCAEDRECATAAEILWIGVEGSRQVNSDRTEYF